MTLNHLNLTVTNPEETSAFLAKHFGLQPRGGNQGMQLLHDDHGMVLTLFKARAADRQPGVAGGEDSVAQVRYPSSFHIGFLQESEARVNQINQQLRDAGVAVDPPARQHGSWGFYFTAPGGFMVEVTA